MDILALLESSSTTVHLVDPTGATSSVPIASLIREVEPTPGKRVAVRRHNDRGYLQSLADAAVAGSILVSVNTKFSDDEADELVARSGAARGTPFADPEVHDPYVVFTTSGTTASPKMVLHTQRSIARHAREAAVRFDYGPDRAVMVALPLCGTFGLTSLLAAVAADADVVLLERFDAALAAELIERYQVTAMNATDDMWHRILDTGGDVSTIEVGGYAAFNSSLGDIVERADAAGATLCGLYGMSEVQALYSLRDPAAGPNERAKAGGALTSADASARVVNPDDRTPLPDGTDGELELRGPSLMAGYLAEGGAGIDRELTAAAIDADGWFATGDLGVIDGDRTFGFLTRLGDTLRLGGFLVSPDEIERVLLELPGVDGAQVIALERPEGTRPVAFVTGDMQVTEAEAIEFCQSHLARFKSPIAVIALDEFPVSESANGVKIRKTELRRLAAERV